jgi:hypothetical protein
MVVAPVCNLRPLARPPIISLPPFLQLKRKRDREADLETGDSY